MARTFGDVILETSRTLGASAYALDGTLPGYRLFSTTFITGDKPYFVVRNKQDTKFEVNYGGTYTVTPGTLNRQVIYSSNANAAVDWQVEDHPLAVYVPRSGEIDEGVVTGFLATVRNVLLRGMAMWWKTNGQATNIHQLNVFDGTNDMVLATCDTANNRVALSPTAGIVTAPGYTFAGAPTIGWFLSSAGIWDWSSGAAAPIRIRSSQIQVGSTVAIGWSSATGVGTMDTSLFRDAAAGILAQRTATATQIYRIYNTYTDASNYQRLSLGGNGVIKTENLGTGVAYPLVLGAVSNITLDETTGTITVQRDGSSSNTLLEVTGSALTGTAILHSRLTPTINQASGTYTVLDINPTETTVGAGPHYLMRARVGAGANVFSVDRLGNTVAATPVATAVGNEVVTAAWVKSSISQSVNTQTGTMVTTTALFPADNTIPQITEGFEVMTAAITPKTTTSKLLIEVTVTAASSVVNTIIVGLFQDAIANALAVSWSGTGAVNAPTNISFRHTMTSGSLTAKTFRVRVGQQLAGTLTLNGSAGTAFFGGVLISSILIREETS